MISQYVRGRKYDRLTISEIETCIYVASGTDTIQSAFPQKWHAPQCFTNVE